MFTVYTKDDCSFCDQAKQLLTNKGIPYRAIKLGEGITRDELLTKFPRARTLPQIVKSDDTMSVVIGGYADLKRHLHVA